MKNASSSDDEYEGPEMVDEEWWSVDEDERKEAEEALYQQIHYCCVDEKKLGMFNDVSDHLGSSPSPPPRTKLSSDWMLQHVLEEKKEILLEKVDDVYENSVETCQKVAKRELLPIGSVSSSDDQSDSSLEYLGTFEKDDKIVHCIIDISSDRSLSSDSSSKWDVICIDDDSPSSAMNRQGNYKGEGNAISKDMSKADWYTDVSTRGTTCGEGLHSSCAEEEILASSDKNCCNISNSSMTSLKHKAVGSQLPEGGSALKTNENIIQNMSQNNLPVLDKGSQRPYVTMKNRYFTTTGPQDAQDSSKNCTELPCVCILCGVKGHIESICPLQLCFNCDLPGHITRTCTEVHQSPRYQCFRCGMFGHILKFCPDLWRQYHLTDEDGVMVYTDIPIIKTTQMYCYNCGVKGHLGHLCKKPRMERIPGMRVRLPSIPTICVYNNPANYVKLPPGVKAVKKDKIKKVAESLKGVVRSGLKRKILPACKNESASKADGGPKSKKLCVKVTYAGASSCPNLSQKSKNGKSKPNKRQKKNNFGKHFAGTSSASFGSDQFHSDDVDLFQGKMPSCLRSSDRIRNSDEGHSKEQPSQEDDNPVEPHRQQPQIKRSKSKRRSLKRKRKHLQKLIQGDNDTKSPGNGQENIDKIDTDTFDHVVGQHTREGERQNQVTGLGEGERQNHATVLNVGIDSHGTKCDDGSDKRKLTTSFRKKCKRGFFFNKNFSKYHWKKSTP